VRDLVVVALQVADWRRRVSELYAQVRAVSGRRPAAAHELWCATRDELFREHPASPLLPTERASFTGLPVAEYDPAWRFELEVEAAAEPSTIQVATGTDGVVPFDLLGTVRVPGAGSLDVWRLASYAGGRYLLDTVKGADLGMSADGHRLVLDFNFAYNPSCAYDPMWACPLPRRGNTLAVAVPVGERSG
jgi:uncharacterized protein (DUF1684 family)